MTYVQSSPAASGALAAPGPLAARDATFVGILAARAAATPDQRAFAFADEATGADAAITYGQLHARACDVALRLRAAGVVSGDRVVLLYPAGLEFIAAIFGCLYAGAIAVTTTDPQRLNRTAARLTSIIRDASPRVGLTAASLAARVPEMDATVSSIPWLPTDDASGDEQAAVLFEPGRIDPASVAMLQYTSGSTSTPKGVVLTHHNLVHNQTLIAAVAGQTSASRFVGWLPPYHDMGLIGLILHPIYLGASCVLLGTMDFLRRPYRWLEAVTTTRATCTVAPNFAFDLCVARIGEAERRTLDLSSLETVINGAEPVREDTLARFSAAFGPCGFRGDAMFPCYGLAEATLLVSGRRRGPRQQVWIDGAALQRGEVVRADAHAGGARAIVSCGGVPEGVHVAIVDPQTRPRVADGRVGEIWVSGESVAAGYWNQPQRSREVFEAMLAGDGRRYLRTGDLGFLDERGLFVSGRLSDLVVIRGRNIHPEDVEHTCDGAHPGVVPHGSAAFGVDGLDGEALVVVQEVKPGAAPEHEIAAAIRRAVSAEHDVEPYAVTLVRPKEVPRTSSGKVRRKTCRARWLDGSLAEVHRAVFDEARVDGEDAAPPLEELLRLTPDARRLRIEDAVRQLLATVARVEPRELDPHRRIRDLGLDSLQSARFQRRLQERLGARPLASEIMGESTIADVAATLARAVEEAAAPVVGPGFSPADIAPVVEPGFSPADMAPVVEPGFSPADMAAVVGQGFRPADVAPVVAQGFSPADVHALAPNQTALWFEYERDPGSSAYHIGGAVRVRGPVDREALVAAFVRVTDRHGALRTTFDASPGAMAARVRPHGFFDAEIADVTGTPVVEIERTLAAEFNRPFDLRRDPPVRLRVFASAPDETFVLLVAHHLVADYASLEILVEEWLAYYRSSLSAGAIAPRDNAAPYSAYVEWYREALRVHGESLRAAERRRLGEDLPLLDLPQSRPPGTRTSRRAARTIRRIDARLTTAITGTAREHGVTPFVVWLAGVATLLHRYTDQTPIPIGTAVAVRPEARFERTLGYCVNTVVLPADVSSDRSGADLLRAVQRQTAAALDSAWYPFAKGRAGGFTGRSGSSGSVEDESTGRSRGSGSVQDESTGRSWRSGSVQEPLDQSEHATDLRDLPDLPVKQVLPDLHDLPVNTARLQTMLVYYGAGGVPGVPAVALQVPGVRMGLGACEVDTVPIERSHCQFDLSFAVAECGDGAACAVEYDAELFEAATIERLLEQLETVLSALAADASVAVGDIPLITGADRERFDAWNATAVTYAEPHVLHALIDAQARRTPGRVAASCGAVSMTFEELQHRAAALAGRLAAAGASQARPTALLLEPGLEIVTATVASLKAGSPYVPIDPADGPDRMRRVLAAARPAVVVTTRALAARVEGSGIPVLCMDDEAAAALPAGAPLPEVAPGDLAYIIYTSGSTGEPKGAMISHRAICNRLLWMRDRYPLGSGDRILQKTPYTFDVSVWELFLPLIAGVEMVVAGPGGYRDPAYLARLVRERSVTVLHFVPSMLAAFLDEPAAAGCTAIRRVFCSGEALAAPLRDRFFERFDAELHNLYGPTEAAVDVTSWECRRDDRGSIVPIGHPIANIELYVLDARRRRVPIGAAGELYIAGVGVGRGYWNEPALTAAAFVELQLEEGRRVRAYKTGDRVRYRSDGSLEFLGRLDHQVKLRGVRIELGEVEAALAQHPAVRCAVAAVRADEGAAPQLVAYVVARGELPSAGELRAFLRQRLPETFLPAHVCVLDELPATSSGKVKRSALPAPAACATLGQADFVEPSTAEERLLAEVWREVLAAPRIGATDNFFELGGDSLRCLQARARALRAGYSFTVEQLFAHPTVRELAPHVTRIEPAEAGATAPFALAPEGARALLDDRFEDAFPLARLQEALFYHSQHDPAYEVYLLSLTVRAPLDEAVLRDSLAALAARHPMLRVAYNCTDFDQIVQVVHRSVAVPLVVSDVSNLDDAEQERAIDEWIESERRNRFDWTVAPLFRVRAHRRGPAAFQLTVSHALYDGWSLSTAIVELLHEYLARRAGRPSPLPPPPAISYREFIAAERSAIASPECRAFWSARLSSGAAMRLEWAPRRDAGSEASRVRQRVPVPPGVAAGLRRLARSVQAPLKSVLLAAHLRVVSLLTGERSVGTGLITNGRIEQPDGDRVVGLFLNTVPLQVTFGRESWREIVRATFRAEQEMWPFRRFPAAEMQTAAGQPPFDTAFNFISFHNYEQVRGTDGTDIISWKNPSDLTYFPLCAYFTEDPVSGQLLFSLDYDVRLLDEERARLAIGYYSAALAEASAQPDAPAADAALLSAEERAAQLAWSVPAPPEPMPDEPVHRLIERSAALRPHAPAIRGSATLDYAELNRRANRLARRLVACGARSETPVGILVDRTPELLVAVLAVLKAGAAFVPLGATLPRERIAAIEADCGLQLAIVDASSPADRLGPEVSRIDVSGMGRGPAVADDGNLDWSGDLDSLAYVMYTSGSTGTPKGVEITHRSLANILLSVGRTVEISSRDAWLAVTALTFDISLLELLLPLVAGATVAVAGSEDVRDGGRLARLCSADVTIVQATPSMWRLILEAGWSGSTGVRVLCGGEPLDRALADALLSRAARVWNVYGPTETTIWSTFAEVTASSEPPAIGRPFANTTVYVLDGERRLLPAGIPGELYIGGAGVARGYRNRPDQTRERFVADPFAGEPGARMYRTGDRVRWRGDGTLECLGRLDGQIKIRGFRVELGEIEHCLRKHPDVSEAVVVVRQVGEGDARLVAWVVPKPGRTAEAAALREEAARALPPYMVPAEFHCLASLPLTPNGKADRRALADAPPPAEAPPAEREPPATETERLVAAVWMELLRTHSIGRHENLFDKGAHSLLLMRASLKFQKARGIYFAPATLFQHPTVARMAALLDGTPIGTRPSEPAERGAGRALKPGLRTAADRRKSAWAPVR